MSSGLKSSGSPDSVALMRVHETTPFVALVVEYTDRMWLAWAAAGTASIDAVTTAANIRVRREFFMAFSFESVGSACRHPGF
jgi:hypothetical protein